MKRIIRCVAFFLAVVMLIATPSFAAEQSAVRGSSYFASSSVYLYKISDTSFRAWFHVTATCGMDKLGASSVRIQESEDGINWTTVQTYRSDVYTNFIAEDTGSHSSYATYTGTRGMYYRAIIILYAEDGNGWAEVTEYTATMKL